MPLRRIQDLDLAGRRVLVRADLNVPLESGRVADDSRIRGAVPTLRHVIDHGGRAIVLAHLGRPKGARDPALSLRPVAAALGSALGAEVRFASDCIGDEAREAVDALPEGGVLLLENLRFHEGEKAGDADFAAALASLGDVCVNDAFSVAHRDHASVTGIARHLPSVAGLLMQREIEGLTTHVGHPTRPLTLILGGAKVSTKIGVVGAMLDRADRILLAGAMANTFLGAQGTEIGRSKHGEDEVAAARELLGRAGAEKILLPTDAVVAREASADAKSRKVPVGEVGPDDMILDIGPETIRAFVAAIGERGTAVWNGAPGLAELEPFADGTHHIAAALADRTATGGLASVVGGGDTVAYLARHALTERFTHVSLAGGAFLRWLAGERLPGVAVLEEGI